MKVYLNELEKKFKTEMLRAAQASRGFENVLQEVWLAGYELSVSLIKKEDEAQQEKDAVEYLETMVRLGLSLDDISIASEVLRSYELQEELKPIQM